MMMMIMMMLMMMMTEQIDYNYGEIDLLERKELHVCLSVEYFLYSELF